jgi:hypothetical protein
MQSMPPLVIISSPRRAPGPRRPPAARGRSPADAVPEPGRSPGGAVPQRRPRLGSDQPGGDVSQHAGPERGRPGEPAGERDDAGGPVQGEDRRDLVVSSGSRAGLSAVRAVAAARASVCRFRSLACALSDRGRHLPVLGVAYAAVSGLCLNLSFRHFGGVAMILCRYGSYMTLRTQDNRGLPSARGWPGDGAGVARGWPGTEIPGGRGPPGFEAPVNASAGAGSPTPGRTHRREQGGHHGR